MEAPLGPQQAATRPGRLSGRDHRLAEHLLDDRLVDRVFVAGQERTRPLVGAVLDRGDDLLDALGHARPGDHHQDQLVLGDEGDVVPPIPFVLMVQERSVGRSAMGSGIGTGMRQALLC